MPDFARMIDEFQYSLIVMIAGVHWGLQKALIMAGYTVKVVNQWLIENAFAPVIGQTNDSLQVAVSIVFVVALLVLGITYLLAVFVRLEVVNLRSAIIWYLAGALFFAVGPSLYQGMNDFRLNIGQVMYLSVVNSLSSSTGNAFASLAQVQSDDLDMGTLCDQFDVYLPGATSAGPIDGLDIAMSYLHAHAQDVMGYPQPIYSPGCLMYFMNPNPSTWLNDPNGSVVPMNWNLDGSYFDSNRSPITWDTLSDLDRDASVAHAGASQRRALNAWTLIFFAFSEQLVHLLITIAMGVTFISFGIAILFAFFKRTESIAQHMINQWIELIVQTVGIALIQALITGFFLAGVASGNAPAVAGIGLICLVFMLIALFSGVKAVWNSFNRLFNAIGQAAGGTILSPGAAAMVTAGGAVAVVTGGASLTASAAGAVAGIGSSALAGMSALNQGATPAQAAGLTLGGNHALSDSARTLTRIPGLRGTPLYEAAEQFVEGAAVRQVTRSVPLLGSAGAHFGRMLLTDRHPDHAAYDEDGHVLHRPMLVPAVGDALRSWSVPKAKRKRDDMTTNTDFDWLEDSDGELYPEFGSRRSRRMGTFTPAIQSVQSDADGNNAVQRERQKSDYAAEMNSEEMEQHISAVMATNRSTGFSPQGGAIGSLDATAAKLERGADALMQTGTLLGQLRVSGSENVAGVLGDVLRLARMSGQPESGMDHLTVGALLAQALGVTPQPGTAPVTTDLARFGLFASTAHRLGLSGDAAERLVHEVKGSPTGGISEERRQTLVEYVQTSRGVSWDSAREEVNHLEAHARRLPEAVTAYGYLSVPPAGITVEPVITVHLPPADHTDDAFHRVAPMIGRENLTGGD